jgi:type I restriction-modification system DNA methylase subunit
VIDTHYTPKNLAQHLVSYIEKQDVSSVADFCVGEGELLKVAKMRWRDAQFYGSDISEDVIHLLRKLYPDWKLYKCDFLNLKLRKKNNFFKNKYDLILLNPPFTCKGATIQSVIFDDTEYHVSTAMAFLVEAIQFLKDDGVIYAILPQSIAYSQKDEKIRKYLIEKYDLKIFEELNNQGFEKCSPNIVLASINDKNKLTQNTRFKQISTGIEQLIIQRGNVSMHEVREVKKSAISLIHSTNLKNNKIVDIKYRVNKMRSRIEGPALLIHRVGQPNINKICIIPAEKAYALSDCVIGLKTKTIDDCILLKKIIMDNWSDFSNLYKGTGAKYITIERLKYFLDL